jgi:hypothetical protein
MKTKILMFVFAFAGICCWAWWSMRRDETAKADQHAAVQLAWVWFHNLGEGDVPQAMEKSDLPFDWDGREGVHDTQRLRALLDENFKVSSSAFPAWQLPAYSTGVEFQYDETLNPEVAKLAPSGAIAVSIEEAHPPANAAARCCVVFVRKGDNPKVVGFRDRTVQK